MYRRAERERERARERVSERERERASERQGDIDTNVLLTLMYQAHMLAEPLVNGHQLLQLERPDRLRQQKEGPHRHHDLTTRSGYSDNAESEEGDREEILLLTCQTSNVQQADACFRDVRLYESFI